MPVQVMPLSQLDSQLEGIDASVTHEVVQIGSRYEPHWLQASPGVRLDGRAKVGQNLT